MVFDFNGAFPLWGICEWTGGIPCLPFAKANPPPHNAKSVIVAAFPYLLPEDLYEGRNIARYAVPGDYHEIAGARLRRVCGMLRGQYPEEAFIWYCDSSPLPEAALAVKAGLGIRGRHNLLITKEYGSWVFLGEIVTTLPTEAFSPPEYDRPMDLCGGCGKCREACPAKALTETGFRRERCLSYLSQRRGALAPEAQQGMRASGIAWGCDICQERCPHNIGARVNPLPEFTASASPRLTAGAPLEHRAYAWRGREILARNLEIIYNA